MGKISTHKILYLYYAGVKVMSAMGQTTKKLVKALLSDGSFIYPEAKEPGDNLYKIACEEAKESGLVVISLVEA